MRQKSVTAMLMALLVSVSGSAQMQHGDSTGAASGKASATHAYFFDSAVLDLNLILPPPPTQSSEITKTEFVELHRIEKQRTPQQTSEAQADDKEQDIFIFRDVFGQDFTEANLPLTAALSAHIHNDEGVASKPLKTGFARPRPFQADASLHPVCELSKEPNSYPSGHTLAGYLLALTLVQMVPEKREQIMKRADEYAHNRLVCGVHYPSDLDASRRAAYVLFGYMMANPRFQKELAAAREETRMHFGLPVAVSRP